eukprot:TRINITY_DN11241_c0_g3_i1.p2 TRINITY_DN11241_c0_g3~~TRINITY_DN11241_c0_g3_i1.p2  ORF type:complete len:343 (+),score=109.59 TRINITY_DN11241_c0_g3_i1:151-1179(+)
MPHSAGALTSSRQNGQTIHGGLKPSTATLLRRNYQGVSSTGNTVQAATKNVIGGKDLSIGTPTTGTRNPVGSGMAAARGRNPATAGRTGLGTTTIGGNFSGLNNGRGPSQPPANSLGVGFNVMKPARQQAGLSPPPTSAPRHLIPKAQHSDERYTIVFDLDETLVSNRMPGLRPALRRPHLDALLRSLKGKAEVVLWTASIESVGKPVLRQIDQNGDLFDHAVYRNPAWFQERPNCPHTKDLRLLGRPMEKVIIIENNPLSVRMNKTSAIMLQDFDRPNPTDSALKGLEKVLAMLIESKVPVQQFVSQSPHLHQMRMVRSPNLPVSLRCNDPFFYLNDKVTM